MGNPEGPHTLLSELVGTRVAGWLGLPVFEHAVVRVQMDGLVDYANGQRSQRGPAFLSKCYSGTAWDGESKVLEVVENLGDIAGLVLLDTWLLNCDRYSVRDQKVRANYRNVFLSDRQAKPGRFRIVALDHTHCFTCGRHLKKGNLALNAIRDQRLFGHFPAFREHLSSEAFKPSLFRLQEFHQGIAERITADLPGEWEATPELLAALVDFLTQRAAFLCEHFLNDILLNNLQNATRQTELEFEE